MAAPGGVALRGLGAQSGAGALADLPIGKIQTVLGPIEPSELGVTLPHEHLLVDFTGGAPPADPGAMDFELRPVTAENSGLIRYHYKRNTDNLRLQDEEVIIEELEPYADAGGRSLVEATSRGIARNPEGLARIAEATGLHIVMGGSFYVGSTHPEDLVERDADELAELIARDVIAGVDDTGIKSGILGEVGCSWPLMTSELKVLRATARAQRMTGAPILVHPGRNEGSPLQILEILADAGADPRRVIMGHLDRTVSHRRMLGAIARTGCYLLFDLFAQEHSYYSLNPKFDMPGDARRMDDIEWLVGQGYGDRVLMSQDICFKTHLLRYGGPGYSYILSHIAPRMRERGFSKSAIRGILERNPASALTFFDPKRASRTQKA